MSYDKSWLFLQELFDADNTVAKLVNKAISLKSNRIVRDSNIADFLYDICSTFTSQSKSISYIDMLKCVVPFEYKNSTECEELESAIIEHIWVNVLAHSSARNLFSKEIRQSDVPFDAKPYLLLYSFGISADWFLYGGMSAFFFVDKQEDKDVLFDCLKQGYHSWNSLWHFYSNWNNLISKLFNREKLSTDQLYPLTILLIVLRREWEYSFTEKYFEIKAKSLSRSIKLDKVNEYLLYSLYGHFKYADKDVCDEIPNNIQNITIHPKIARNLVKIKAYSQLMYTGNWDGIGMNIVPKKEKYEHIESYLDEKFKDSTSPKRLLLDSFFPYTKVRDNDVYIPSKGTMGLMDKIYLSFQLGKDFIYRYRYPNEEELFDFIQIEPTINSNNDYNDSRVIVYRKHLKPTGDFLLVQSKYEAEKQDSIKQAFSDFRHDLKDITGNKSIDILSKRIVLTKSIFEKTYRLQQQLERFITKSDDNDNNIILRANLRELDNDKSIQRMDSRLSKQICKIRDAVENYIRNGGAKDMAKIEGVLCEIKLYMSQKVINEFEDSLGELDRIKYTYDTLCDYIEMAGTPKKQNKTRFCLNKFIHEFIDFANINVQRVAMTFVDNDTEYTVSYNTTILKVMLSTIVDNALKHGFENTCCDNPIIQFSIIDKEEFLVLKVANNGKPIDILTHDYKSRGIFKGVTGHTGLGGYLVSKYAEQMGGYIDLPQQKEWNTEIDIYIKKIES